LHLQKPYYYKEKNCEVKSLCVSTLDARQGAPSCRVRIVGQARLERP